MKTEFEQWNVGDLIDFLQTMPREMPIEIQGSEWCQTINAGMLFEPDKRSDHFKSPEVYPDDKCVFLYYDLEKNRAAGG